MFFPYYFDPTMIILIPALILAMYAQFKVKSTYGKYSQVISRNGLTGAEVARELLRQNGIYNVTVHQIGGHLTDHYDPTRRVVNLSPQVYGSSSLAAIGVAAHEVGHAIQDALNYRPLKIRASLVPAANIGSSWGIPLALIGFFMNSQFMMNLGLVLFVGALLFHLVTLPVEFNASNRAIALLDRGRYLSRQELGGAKKVLRAAAFTYVAATLVALANLLRILMLIGIRRDD
ncbi:MAG TPA: zinc metallopeptidase [Halanaerobiaceae bacterium]|mgnify:CR=1 FL=1|jgi:Zn-dependent membrane protease YugP|nr:zinc metallopeptidase [Bacillota bacterium]HHU92781.1 zinc metallopeptidase [Halanaerobiaceae bacterium]HOA40269.1 zinc metallopeptidase [Halanaerobiales bacterium]HPZ62422.1 zinc metallopeptidase [Halanaerobiales bacterium]HQD03820.1 zinc metallopeptidase [Halanaerobiales bacterium]